MKFRVRFYDDKWSGRTCSTGRQVKQKTFHAEDWDDAEVIEQTLREKLYIERGKYFSSQLSVVK
jgi:hypothetical protein